MKFANVTQLIDRYERGDFLREINAELSDAITQINDMSGQRPDRKFKTSVTIKVDIEVKGQVGQVTCDFTIKKPKLPRGFDMYWTTADGSLSDSHPRQIDMFKGDNVHTIDRSGAEDAATG